MGAFDDLIPAFRTATRAPATARNPNAGVFDDLVPAPPVPGYRADEADGINPVTPPRPPVQAAAPRDIGVGTALLEGFENTMRAVGQGTKPYVLPGDGREVLGEVSSVDDAGTQYYRNADGKEFPVVPSASVVLRDPSSGKLVAYTRSDKSDEGGLAGATRVISQGLMTGPVTGPGRAPALAGPAAGELSASRAATAADDAGAFARSRVPMFSPAFSEGPARGMAKALADTPVIGGPLNKALNSSLQGVANAADEVSGKLGSKPNPQQAGQTVREGIERFKDARPADVVEDGVRQLDDARLSQIILAPTAETSFKTKQGALYERAWRLIPDEMEKGRSVKGQSRFMSAPSETKAVIDDILTRNARMTNTQSGKVPPPPIASGLLGRMIDAVTSKGWTANLQTLRNMRSEVRRLASGMADTEKNVLKASDLDRIQSAITRDMIGQLKANAARYIKDGNLDAAAKIERSIKEFSRADQYTALSFRRMEAIEKLFNADTGEALARNITNAALGGGRGNIQMLQTLNKTLRPDEMGEVRSMLFGQLGRPVASARGVAEETGFSVNSFATRWNAMSPEAKALLFSGEHKRAIDDVVTVANRLANVEAMGNVSRSGAHAVNVGGLATLGYSLATFNAGPALTTGAGGYGLAYMLSRPTYARWTAQWLQLRSQAEKAPKAINNALVVQANRLREMAQYDPALQPILQSISREIGIGKGADEHGEQNEGVGAPEEGKRSEAGNEGGASHAGTIPNFRIAANPGPNTDGSVLKAGRDPSIRDYAADAFGAVLGGDATHKNANYTAIDALSLLPPVGAAVGVDEARVLDAEGSPVQAAGFGILSMLPGGRGAAKGAEAALQKASQEVTELSARFKSLFGKEYAAPRAPSGTPIEDVLKGELRKAEDLREQIAQREAEIAAKPEPDRVPRVIDRSDEREAMLRGIEENPTTRAIPGKQGAPSVSEQKKLINRYYDKPGEPLPEKPWGRDPLDYQEVVRKQWDAETAKKAFDAERKTIAKLNEELKEARALSASAANAGRIRRLKADLREANRDAVSLQQEVVRLRKLQEGGDK